ncbi:LLM class flavin-dependent oxidoreductase [Mycolicibacterium moriokaense]|uniref:Alkanesulfonate monooxygenase SsuD/methylene tetrahydromethanopterin reductase-like flavin-dependent oxidoreductase (Luciferase family) n=1 Tax=Mycolicibacterium moriokaense TaxID=39691 RepID=A0A318HJ67_9MYCO|nr:LLM class flavin-dependent oxidoreductase [Mycolicibacterium moriokaense]PXX07314.1 alkanesulfonate monooxygenase SsuD/methylene tetrahydromethanopterin reductase-like flavin-dependent oxidoreductase (luciferase family) [Mycolicibacterium moriokaense]
MKISAQFATSLHSPADVEVAEHLGYDRAWLFDTPHESPDVWMMLALAAERTTTIGLGPGVLVPTLRHPMVNASAAAALAALAPGRVAVAFGVGFAGARAMGAAPATWSYVRDYVRAFRGLLSGARVEWQGTRMQMMHPVGHAPERPIDIPILISALGPKGVEVATELADGLFTVNGETRYAAQFSWAALGVHGTVLADGEALDSVRVQAAAGPGNALAYHAAYEFGGDVTALPGGDVWLDIINQSPPQDRHLAVHDQHLVALNHADTAAWAAGSWKAIRQTTVTGTADEIGQRVSELAAAGITEIIYQPTGPDIIGELETFRTAAKAADLSKH